MPGRVVDASVLGALIFGEPDSAEVVSLLGEAEIYAPTLLSYELASIALKKISRYPEQREALLQAVALSLAMDIRLMEVNGMEVVDLALETGLTVYDASYLYLSRNLGIELITFDRMLRDAASMRVP